MVTLVLAAIPTTIGSLLAAIMAILGLKKSNQIHSLVNGSMLIQLELNARTSRALADNTQNAEHIAAAELAEKLAREHQAKLDSIIYRGQS